MAKVNKDSIRKALDSFEADDFLTAKDIIKGEIKSHVSDYYKERLELTKDLVPPVVTQTDGDTE